jgi:uncharacterized DUF497 family protein
MLEHLIIAPDIRDKLLRPDHNVKEDEVRECFLNHDGFYLEDNEEDHQTDPPSEWFVGETDRGRLLKIIFVFRDGNLYLKSAYDANEKSQRIYNEAKANA